MGSSAKVSALIEMSQSLIRSGHIDSARSMLREMLKEEPNDGRIWYAYSFVAEGLDKQIEALEKTLALKPDSQRATRRLRQLKTQLAPNQRDSGLNSMPDALTAHPDTDTLSPDFTPHRRQHKSKPPRVLIVTGAIVAGTFLVLLVLSVGKLAEASKPAILPSVMPLGAATEISSTPPPNP